MSSKSPTRGSALPGDNADEIKTPLNNNEKSRRVTSLWDKAIQALCDEDKKQIDLYSSDKLAVLNDVLETVELKKKECMEKRWKYKNKNGEYVILRDLFEKTTKWIKKFKEIGDMAVQYDPAHAALPWAGVRFLLQVAVNDYEIFGAMVEGIEFVSNLITRCAIFENLYLQRVSIVTNQLAEALIKLYAAILSYLANARRYYTANTGMRIAKSVTHPADAIVDSYLRIIAKEKMQVEDMARVADAHYHQKMGDRLNELDERFLKADQNMNVKVSTLISELAVLHEDVSGLRTSVESNENCLHRKLETVLRALDEPIVRVADQVSSLRDNFQREERLKVFRWMSTIPYRGHHKTSLKDILPNSGRWLSEKPEFTLWKKSSVSSLLWLHGTPGSGKSKLLSTVIQNILEENATDPFAAPLAYFYCTRDDAEKQRAEPEEILRCILKQLSCSKPDIPIKEPVARAYRERREDAEQDGSEPLKLSVEESTELIIALLDFNPSTIVVDALDECQPSRRYELLNALNKIVNKSANIIKILVSSRDDVDIILKLSEAPNIFVSASDVRSDIERFVYFEVERAITDGRLLHGQVSNHLKDCIITKLVDGAGGMFRWVSLQIQNLCNPQRMKIEDDIFEELGRLPQTLADLYALTYKQVAQTGDKGRSIAERALKWLLCAQRPLSTQEFIAAVSVSPEGKAIFLSKAKVLELCCNLVILDNEFDTFRFAHLSIREYLESRPEYAIHEINAIIAERCLEVYLHDQNGKSSSEMVVQQNIVIRQYASSYWVFHYQKLTGKRRKDLFKAKVEKFLFGGVETHSSFSKWTKDAAQECKSLYWDEKLKSRLAAVISSPPSSLFTASVFGLSEILEKLIIIGNTDWNQRNLEGSTALHLAIREGHEAVVQWLLKKEVDVEVKDRYKSTAMHIAARYGREAILRMLLVKGADATAKDRDGWTPLFLAVRNGHKSVVQLLLKGGHGITATDSWGWTMLHWAAREGQTDVARLLIDKGANIAAQDGDGWTALYLAARHGHEAVARLLLNKEPTTEVKDRYGWTTLHWAAREGHEGVVQLLLANGSNVATNDTDGWTALHWAACYGQKVVVRLLLEKGADSRAKSKCGETALTCLNCQWQNCYEHEEVARLL